MEDSNCIKILFSDLHKPLRETEMIDSNLNEIHFLYLRIRT